ncbi:MAG: carboxypeptidase [Phyllobacterium sp.]|uniref:S10 family peptidase n=1 Tax=Phyllobacterium sp. TaxID=1871046 RepID=UPI0030F1D78D
MYLHRITLRLAVALTLLIAPAFAQDDGRQDSSAGHHNATTAPRSKSATPPANGESGILGLLPADSVTQHVLKTRAGTIAYTATAGTLSLFGQDGERSAKIFYTAYVARERKPGRPLTFAFNGGPGAASAYLHLGLVGPRILEFGPNGQGATNPTLVDNPDSWLAFTDLVLIDPVGTGWSRARNDSVASGFFGVGEDADSIAKAIALYVTQNDRITSPKYLLGESYGGFRAAKVASALKDNQGMLVSGIVMLSPLIEGQLLFGDRQYPLWAALQLPSLVAGELERKNAFDPVVIERAEQFAMTDYLVALAGPEPTGDAAKSLYARIAQMTGIPEAVVARTRGFLGDVYVKHSKSAEFEVVSPYDASFAVADPYPESDTDQSNDAVLDGFTRAYGAAFASYARNELGFATELTYNLLATNVNEKWEWGRRGRSGGTRTQASATGDIRDLLSVIPSFRLLVAQGYSDAITPYGMNKYVIDHLPAALAAGRVDLKLYRGGHMFYTRTGSRQALSADAREFYSAGVGKLQGE